MKNKVLRILFILLIALTITACNDSKNEKTGKKESKDYEKGHEL